MSNEILNKLQPLFADCDVELRGTRNIIDIYYDNYLIGLTWIDNDRLIIRSNSHVVKAFPMNSIKTIECIKKLIDNMIGACKLAAALPIINKEIVTNINIQELFDKDIEKDEIEKDEIRPGKNIAFAQSNRVIDI